jgi:hypothetical protein
MYLMRSHPYGVIRDQKAADIDFNSVTDKAKNYHDYLENVRNVSLNYINSIIKGKLYLFSAYNKNYLIILTCITTGCWDLLRWHLYLFP